MGTFWAVVVVLGAAALIFVNIKLDDPVARRNARILRRQEVARQESRIACPHCDVAGNVSVGQVVRKKGISGGKATGALLTGGASMLLTGLSRKEQARRLSCGNCGMSWDVA